MEGNLFRKSALEHQKDRLLGEVLVTPPVRLSLVAMFITIWVVLVVLWLSTSSYTRKESVTGWLEPNQGLIKVFADANNGRVKQVLVSEGQPVVKDQPLVVINGDRVLSTGVHLEQELLLQYKQQSRLLDQQLSRTSNVYALRMQDVEQQIVATELELKQVMEQVVLYQERYDLIAKRNQEYNEMRESGHLARLEFDSALREELSVKGDLKEVQRLEVIQRNNLQQLKTQKVLLPQEKDNELATIKSRLSDIALQIAQIHGQRAYVIKATQSGIVSNIQVNVGQFTQTNLPLMTITPTDSQLIAKLIIPVRSAGFIEKEQGLDIRFDAFPYQKFGIHKGTITAIADSVLMPNEFKFLPVTAREPVYLVTATLQNDQVSAYGKQMMLRSGMTLSADVLLSDRTLLEWLLEPIYSIKGRL